MAHEIDLSGRYAQMAYVRGRPRHGLGVRVPEYSSCVSAMKDSDLDWSVQTVPRTPGDDRPNEERVSIIRKDLWIGGRGSQAVLGIAPIGYKPIQNHYLASVLDRLCQLNPGTRFDTAGTLGNGTRSWVTVRLPTAKTAGSAERTEMYLAFVNRFDRRCIEARLTPVRVECADSLARAVPLSLSIELPHHRCDDDLMLNTAAWFGRIGHAGIKVFPLFRRLANACRSEQQAEEMFDASFPDPLAWTGHRPNDEVVRAREFARLLCDSIANSHRFDAAWSAWTASRGGADETRAPAEEPVFRLQSIWFEDGQGARLRAMPFTFRLVGATPKPNIRSFKEADPHTVSNERVRQTSG